MRSRADGSVFSHSNKVVQLTDGEGHGSSPLLGVDLQPIEQTRATQLAQEQPDFSVTVLGLGLIPLPVVYNRRFMQGMKMREPAASPFVAHLMPWPKSSGS